MGIVCVYHDFVGVIRCSFPNFEGGDSLMSRCLRIYSGHLQFLHEHVAVEPILE